MNLSNEGNTLYIMPLCLYKLTDFMAFTLCVLEILVAVKINLKPFQANVPYLYPVKTSENQRFSDVFRGHINRTLA